MKIHLELFIITIFNPTSFMNRICSIFLVSLGYLSQVGQAQDNPSAVPSPPPPPAPLVSTTPAAEGKLVPVRERERTVYVPEEELEKIFQDGGRGVFLPYREF